MRCFNQFQNLVGPSAASPWVPRFGFLDCFPTTKSARLWIAWFMLGLFGSELCVFFRNPRIMIDIYNRKVFPGSYRWYSFYISSFPSSSFDWGVAIDALEPQGSLADFPCQGNARVISMSNFGGVLLFGIQKIIDFKGIRPVFWIKWRYLPYIRPI